MQLLAEKGNDLGQLNGTLAPADRHARHRHRADRAADPAVRHRVDHRRPALGPAQRRHHPAVRRQLQPGHVAGAEHPAARGRRRHGDHGGADAGSQPGQRRRDPRRTATTSSTGAATRLRPQLQLARPEPAALARRDRRLPRRAAARPAGRHLPPPRDQPRHRPVGGGAGHPEPVRQPLVGLLRPARQRDPDHPQHADRAERATTGAVPAAKGAPADRERDAGRAAARRPRRRRATTPKSSGSADHTRRRCRRRPPRRPTPPAICSRTLLGCKGRARRRKSPEQRPRRPAGQSGAAAQASAEPATAANTPSRHGHGPAATRERGPVADGARRLAPGAAAAGTRPRPSRRTRGLLSQWAHDVGSWF